MGLPIGGGAANSTLPRWIQNCKEGFEQKAKEMSCVEHWPRRPPPASAVFQLIPSATVDTMDVRADVPVTIGAHDPSVPRVVLFMLFKNVRLADLIRFVDYHLLLGVDHLILVDNSCGNKARAARRVLAPYVARGLVTVHMQFVCTELRAMMFMHNFRGGSSMARQLSGSSLGLLTRGALVVSLDDDEYLVLADPTATLHDIRAELTAKKVCAVTLPWRVFGSSGHRCQPSGPLMGRFVRRTRTEKEVKIRRQADVEVGSMRKEARERHLNTPYGGKPVFIYDEPTSPQCGTHWCDDCPIGLSNCALPEGPGVICEQNLNLTGDRMWVNHYAFQSLQHWETKKLRGRTNQLPSRTGSVPSSYERIFDAQAYALLRTRVERVARPGLRKCMRELFFD